MNYYIADLHLGHRDILAFDRRPFPDVDTMNEYLVQSWNARVGKEDHVYVLGDAVWPAVSERESLRLLRRLEGHKHLVLGNHDRPVGRQRYQWESIAPYMELRDGDRTAVLSHYPMPIYRDQHTGAVMLHGHVHDTGELKLVERWRRELWARSVPCRMINVGCMMPYMNYAPHTLQELLAANPFPEEEKE